jgi:hypothetical protein
MAQLVAPRQSIGPVHPPTGQSILQAMPIGQVMAPLQGEQAEPQEKVQTPFSQAPPAARQSAQGTPPSGGPQTVVPGPPSTPRPPEPTAPPRPPRPVPPVPPEPPRPEAPPGPESPASPWPETPAPSWPETPALPGPEAPVPL